MGRVIRAIYPRATVTALDYVPSHLDKADPPKIVADAFASPFRDGAFDYVFCSMFLHHFPDDQVVELLRDFGRVARRQVFVSDLERHPLAYYFLPATKWILGWDSITLHDGPISVEAAFHAGELAALARRAGLRNVVVRRFRPAFRLALVAGS
jgi:ubiquinone/menaquinone biosynthesis C-methylase UbiE